MKTLGVTSIGIWMLALMVTPALAYEETVNGLWSFAKTGDACSMATEIPGEKTSDGKAYINIKYYWSKKAVAMNLASDNWTSLPVTKVPLKLYIDDRLVTATGTVIRGKTNDYVMMGVAQDFVLPFMSKLGTSKVLTIVFDVEGGPRWQADLTGASPTAQHMLRCAVKTGGGTAKKARLI